MEIYNKKQKNRMLIISNNPLSLVRNNGKTILSFIQDIPKDRIQQLFFSEEVPVVEGYSYFQLSDIDVIKGYFIPSIRGKEYYLKKKGMDIKSEITKNKIIKKNLLTRILREIIWFKHWKSKKMVKWLDKFKPDIVFFVAGDSGFAYDITNYIVDRYNAKLITYITDDYIMPKESEKFLEKKIREYIKRKMLSAISKSKNYFTISELMKRDYSSLSGKNSEVIMNATSSLYQIRKNKNKSNIITFIYAGSLYYNRDKILGKIADAIYKYNKKNYGISELKMEVYSTNFVSKKSKKFFERENICKFCGSLDLKELKEKLNEADILLFIESFERESREKIRYSLSTKIPEYLSLEKPIFAVGPKEVGSIEYLKDVAFLAYSEEEIYSVLEKMLLSKEEMITKAKMAKNKFEEKHCYNKIRKKFMNICEME